MYLVQRNRTWWAFHDVPPSLRTALGRSRFYENLRTHDRRRARILAATCEAQWLAEIERARQGTDAAAEATFWRKRLAEAKSEPERKVIEDQIIDAGADRVGLIAWEQKDEPGFEEERAKLAHFVALATGDAVPFEEHLDDYAATLHGQIEAKSLHMKRTNLERFGAIFATTADIDRGTLQRWVNAEAGKGAARATITRAVGDLRGYWKFLVGLGAARETPDPFDRIAMVGAKRTKKKPFQPADLVRIEAKARDRGDGLLADFVLLDMYTGARAEEIATLKSEHVDLTKNAIAMPGTKTEAAPREVPIHAKLRPLLRRLVKDANGGYLFPGLRADKFGDRYKAVTKRFATLKAGLGFGDQYDFHSIRRTVCMIFEDAGVAENVVAHIVGHKFKTMSYGLYSGGVSLATKAKAIAKLRYPTKA